MHGSFPGDFKGVNKMNKLCIVCGDVLSTKSRDHCYKCRKIVSFYYKFFGRAWRKYPWSALENMYTSFKLSKMPVEEFVLKTKLPFPPRNK